jgi:hypothetical protein
VLRCWRAGSEAEKKWLTGVRGPVAGVVMKRPIPDDRHDYIGFVRLSTGPSTGLSTAAVEKPGTAVQSQMFWIAGCSQ